MKDPQMKVGDFPLENKVVAVTGGGSGICARFVKRAADLGAKVIAADVALTDDAKQLFGDDKNIVYQKCDVAKWDELHQLVTVAKEKFGSTPDVYVAGAGVFEPKWSNFWHDPEDDHYRQIDINLDHPIKLTRIALKQLASEDRKGVILPIASVGGIAGLYTSPIYIATKHGLVGFVKSLKLTEKYEGIKVVAICPGAVDSPLWTAERRERVNFGKLETLAPDDVAKAMIDLVQDGKYGGGTCLEIMPNNGPKTRVIPEWNIDPPKGGSTTQIDPNSTDIPQAFMEMKEAMGKDRGTAK